MTKTNENKNETKTSKWQQWLQTVDLRDVQKMETAIPYHIKAAARQGDVKTLARRQQELIWVKEELATR